MPCKDDAALINWVTNDAELCSATRLWGSVVGIDTEFLRTNTFYPIPGLYQIISNNDIFLIDPLGITDWQPLVEVLEDPAIQIVMHACSEDLELIRHHFGAVPRGVFDTQLAHAFLSTDFSTSYANLVSNTLDVTLGKHETRSNWLQRPLTDEQLRYACEDVVHLPQLHKALETQLEAEGRLAWFHETMRDHGRYEPGDPDEYYRNIKKAWKLDGSSLAVLRVLTAWRERQAMAEDVPRNRVVWDEHLYIFAELKALDETVVWATLPKPVARKYADELIEQHAIGLHAEAIDRLQRPLTQAQGALSRSLRDIARSHADQHEFAHELLARKRDVEGCVRHFVATGELSPIYGGWRYDLVGDQFREVLEQHQ